MLADLSSDVTLKNLKNNSSIDKFLIKVHSKCEMSNEKALRILLIFPSTYSCETGFSTVTVTKTKYVEFDANTETFIIKPYSRY